MIATVEAVFGLGTSFMWQFEESETTNFCCIWASAHVDLYPTAGFRRRLQISGACKNETIMSERLSLLLYPP